LRRWPRRESYRSFILVDALELTMLIARKDSSRYPPGLRFRPYDHLFKPWANGLLTPGG
jgi:hypothetical protein